MFKGRRDDHVSIRVPQENCFRYHSDTTGNWVEVKLPGFNDDEWESFMVDPKQVFYDHKNPTQFNIIEGLNRDTAIKVTAKMNANNNSGRVVDTDSEVFYDPLEIIVIFIDCNNDNIDYNDAVNFTRPVEISDDADNN